MITLTFKSPIKVSPRIAVALSHEADNTTHTIYIRKGENGPFMCMNSIVSMLWTRIKLRDRIWLGIDDPEISEQAAYDALDHMKKVFFKYAGRVM